MKRYTMLRLDSEDIQNLAYPVIVEGWDHKSYGRMKRAWLSEFTKRERKFAGELYKKFYNWYLRTGAPETCSFKPSTLDLIHRLTNFFYSFS